MVLIVGLSKELPSNSNGMAQFQEVMRQQLESSMHAELEKLLGTAKGAEAEVRYKHFLKTDLPFYYMNDLCIILFCIIYYSKVWGEMSLKIQ